MSTKRNLEVFLLLSAFLNDSIVKVRNRLG
jgi:hypothetical protein